MKQLFTILMSLNLILAPVALAADGTQKTGDEFRANPNAKGGMDFMKNIMSIGTGIIGVNALMTCKTAVGTAPSIYVLAAGSAIFIMSELLGGKAHNDYLRKSAADLKMVEEKLKKSGGGGEVQLASLEAALNNEKEILKFINKRKMWATATMAVYAAGIAAVIIENANFYNVAPAGCTGEGIIKHRLTGVAIGAAYSFMAGGMASGLVTGLGTYLIGPGAMSHMLLNTKYTRGAFFGAATAIQLFTVMDLGKKAKIAQENIGKLEKAITEFKATSGSTNGLIAEATSGVGSGMIDPNDGREFAVKPLPQTDENSIICASNAGGSVDISSKACAQPMRLAAAKFDPRFNVPSLTAFNQQAADVGNALNSGDLAGAEIGAAALASQAGRMNQIKDNLLKQTNAKLKAQGKKPIDFDADTRNALRSMASASKSSNPSMSAALTSLAEGKTELPDDLKGSENLGTSQNIIANAPAAAPETATPNLSEGLNEGIEPTPTLSKVDDIMKSDDFEYDKNDISKQKETSLFNIVSSRYLISYPKIFKLEEPETVPAKPVPQKK